MPFDPLAPVSESNPLPVAVVSGGGGGGGGTTVDKEFVVVTYRAKAAFTGASVGDTITATQVYDLTGASPVLSTTIWYNQTTNAVISAPSASNLEIVGAQALTDAQLRATPLSIANQNLINLDVDLGAVNDAAATSDTGNFSLISLFKRLLIKTASLFTTTPSQDASASPVRVVGQEVITAGFSAVGASVIDPVFNTPIVGTGVSYNQASGSLNIVAGTTTNAEFLARSARAFRGSMRLRHSIIASQRIVNNNFAILLADLIGEGLAYNIISATQVNVVIPSHGFTSQMVGQFCLLGGFTGAAAVPGRYAIASIVDSNTVQFTVAGFPASGTGTCTVFGRNYIRNLITGVTATNTNFDAQRNGWATGDTVATINTTASPGTICSFETTGRDVFFMDALRATTLTPAFATRASRYENIPDQNVDLYIFLWNFNGTTAPASSTTFTLGHLSLETFANIPVYLQGQRAQGANNPIPVTFPSAQSVSVSAALPAGTNAIGSLAAGTNNIGYAGLQLPLLVADVASAALTTTTTTAAITPAFGCSYEVNIPVTAVSGTTPTLDVSIEESDDGGTNWYKVYDFPRITATGMYRSPKLPLTGNRVRYVQTVGGTTPSFTRAVNRLQSSDRVSYIRQLVDRTIVLTTLNSTTISINTQNCNNVQLVINIGAATTAPSIQLQGSDDGGATWYNIGTPLAAVANSSVQSVVTNNNAQLIRGLVSTAGTGVTAGYVQIKGF